MDNPAGVFVKDKTNCGKCSDCGECCTNMLPLSQNEIGRIKAYIKKHNVKEQRHNFMVGIDMTCPFRDDANKISAYIPCALIYAEILFATSQLISYRLQSKSTIEINNQYL